MAFSCKKTRKAPAGLFGFIPWTSSYIFCNFSLSSLMVLAYSSYFFFSVGFTLFQASAISASFGKGFCFSLARSRVFWTNKVRGVTFLVFLAFSNQESFSFFFSMYSALSSKDILLQSSEAFFLTSFGSSFLSKPSLRRSLRNNL